LTYQVDLDVFNGPMDLLLYLISREEVDIQEIAISRIVDQYLAYLAHLEELNVEITSDFLVMASTLILIKSKALLPTEELDLEEEIDQQDDLIQHLLEYKKVKILSRGLERCAERHALRLSRSARVDLPPEEDTVEEEDLNLWDILHAFARIVKETGLGRTFRVIHSEKPLISYISAILRRLEEAERIPFEAFFENDRTRGEAISHFVGILELVRRRIVEVRISEEGSVEVALRITCDELQELKTDGEYRLSALWAGGLKEPEDEEEDARPSFLDAISSERRESKPAASSSEEEGGAPEAPSQVADEGEVPLDDEAADEDWEEEGEAPGDLEDASSSPDPETEPETDPDAASEGAA
jgi:segregation and condensation protein A